MPHTPCQRPASHKANSHPCERINRTAFPVSQRERVLNTVVSLDKSLAVSACHTPNRTLQVGVGDHGWTSASYGVYAHRVRAMNFKADFHPNLRAHVSGLPAKRRKHIPGSIIAKNEALDSPYVDYYTLHLHSP